MFIKGTFFGVSFYLQVFNLDDRKYRRFDSIYDKLNSSVSGSGNWSIMFRLIQPINTLNGKKMMRKEGMPMY